MELAGGYASVPSSSEFPGNLRGGGEPVNLLNPLWN
jgi:hypothetical protein